VSERGQKILSLDKWHDSMDSTLARERQLKHWSAKKKEALIDDDLSALKSLSRRRGR
jgi:predicted GIY-YIG superfamily endonuclease